MKYSYNLSGADQQLIKEYPVDADAVIKKGQPVTFLWDKVIDMSNTVSSPIGIAEEDHLGVYDELNPRSNGTKIRVSISPTAVYTAKVKPFEIVTGGMGSFYTTTDNISSSFLSNHKIVLVEKSEFSLTTLEIGDVVSVASATTNGKNIQVTTGDNSCFEAGDKYLAIPNIGEKISGSVSGDYFYYQVPDQYTGYVCVAIDIENQTIDAKVFNSCLDK